MKDFLRFKPERGYSLSVKQEWSDYEYEVIRQDQTDYVLLLECELPAGELPLAIGRRLRLVVSHDERPDQEYVVPVVESEMLSFSVRFNVREFSIKKEN